MGKTREISHSMSRTLTTNVKFENIKFEHGEVFDMDPTDDYEKENEALKERIMSRLNEQEMYIKGKLVEAAEDAMRDLS